MHLRLFFYKRYWPRHINGDAIRAGAASLELEKCVAKCGLASKLGSQPVPFFVACLRDSNHVVRWPGRSRSRAMSFERFRCCAQDTKAVKLRAMTQLALRP
jgi:hypothetical protein